MMALVARLEVQAKHRIVERNFAAARYQLAVPRERPWKLRLALVAIQVSPRLMRAAYLRMRPTLWKNRPWLPADGHPAACKTNIGRTPDAHETKRCDISASTFPRIYIGDWRADR